MLFKLLHVHYLFLAAALCYAGFATAADLHPWPKTVSALLMQPENQIDFLELKLAVDQAIDPSMAVDATKKRFETMLSGIQRGLPKEATSLQKLRAIRLYIYGKGPWNNFKPFQYDFSDPDGKNIRVKLLSNYLDTRKGNCVSMPILMMLIADRMGLDVSMSYAPAHMLVKFTELETGKPYNVEATSGGGFSRDKWYQESMHVTDDEIRNGVYLQKLSRKETAYALVDLLTEHYIHLKAYKKALDLAQISLKQNPGSVHFMLRSGSIYAKLIKEDFYKYERISEIPSKDRSRFYFLRDQNQKYFEMAEARGWREKPQTTATNNQEQSTNRYGT